MPATHVIRRAGALAVCLSVLVALSSCGTPTYGSMPMYPVAETDVASPDPSSSPAPDPTDSPTPGPTDSPPPTVSPTPTPSPTPPPVVIPPCPQSSGQRLVETALAKIRAYGPIVVDGIQTAADCDTIKRFQRRMGILPANGSAGPTTTSVALRIAATDYRACRAGTATMACIDLTHQTFYIMRGGHVILGPTVTRTGKPGYRTPAGTFRINARSLRAWSRPYKVWLPYWQHFYRGMGLHQTTTYIHNMSIGSHGCVNLLYVDAKNAYALLRYWSIVRAYGRRPGT